MKIMLRRIILAIIAIVLVTSFVSANCYAVSKSDVNTFKGTANPTGASKMKSIIGAILGGVKYACAAIAIIILTVLAAKYMLSAPADRADIKTSMTTYVLGALVLFSASGIVSLVQKISENVKA